MILILVMNVCLENNLEQSFIDYTNSLTPKERKLLLKQLKNRFRILSDVKPNKKQVNRELERVQLGKETRRLQQKLYYIQHKEMINQNRKHYKRKS